MSTYFLSRDLWPRIRTVVRDAGPRFVASPYVSRGASRRLPLKRGDLLVTRCNKGAAQAGQTDPREIVRYLQSGVRVHHVETLHAKVYVSANRCVVSSANVSKESEARLVEAGIESTDPKLIGAARTFVREMTGELVEEDFARALIKFYRPPKVPRGAAGPSPRSKVRHSGLWVMAVEDIDFTAEDEAAATAGELEAKRRGADPRRDRFERISISGRTKGPAFGDRLAQVDTSNRRKFLIPPARVMSVRRYTSARGAKKQMLTVTLPRGSRRISLRSVGKSSGPAHGPLALTGCVNLTIQSWRLPLRVCGRTNRLIESVHAGACKQH